MKLIFKCKYNGNRCIKEKPKLKDDGEIIFPKLDRNGNWESCINCENNHCIGSCCGLLYLIDGYAL